MGNNVTNGFRTSYSIVNSITTKIKSQMSERQVALVYEVYARAAHSPYLFNIMCELLMRLALDGFEGGFRIGGRLGEEEW